MGNWVGKLKGKAKLRSLQEGAREAGLEIEKIEKEQNTPEEHVRKLEASRSVMVYLLKDMERARQELERAYEELKALDQMKDEFLEMTSHELKTPLTSMSSFVQLLLDGKLGKLMEQQKSGLEIISEDVKRLEDSVDKIMDISRLKSGVIKPVFKNLKLREVIQSAVESVMPFAYSKQVKITQKINKLPAVKGDKILLGKVVLNLVGNAIKFTPPNGEVSVESSVEDSHVVVSVKDTGIGIAKENMPQLFTKFFQVDHSTPGPGLGLSICKVIVEAHGGRIWAESQVGKGSTFCFTLPTK
jgi:hypothetical protein